MISSLAMLNPLKIVVPQNQKTTIQALLKKAGWEPVWERGKPKPGNVEGDTLHRGTIITTGDTIIEIRSMDALRLIAGNRYDIGLVGGDCLAEKPTWKKQVEDIGKLRFGRDWGYQTRVEIIAHPDSHPIGNISDVKTGSIFFSERPNITAKFLRDNNLEPEFEGDQTLEDFRSELIKRGKVGICTILGSSPVQLEPDGDFGVIVNESGDTIGNYGTVVVAKMMEFETHIIASPGAFRDPDKHRRILNFAIDVEGAYNAIQRDFEGRAELNRVPNTFQVPNEGTQPVARKL